MTCYYILDGYNVMRGLPRIINLNFEDRLSFINFLYMKIKPNNKILVVFDGYGEERIKYPEIEICFSKDVSADEYILNLLKGKIREKSPRVITDDQELKNKLKLLSIDVLRIEEFASLILRKMYLKGKKRKKFNEKPSLYSRQAFEIRKELERLWIQRK